MTYYFCQFRGYRIVVYTDSCQRAKLRLIEYVNTVKGNLSYSKEEIKKESKVKPIDLVDDLGHLSKLQDIEREIESIRRKFNSELDEKLGEFERVRQGIRQAAEMMGSVLRDEYDY